MTNQTLYRPGDIAHWVRERALKQGFKRWRLKLGYEEIAARLNLWVELGANRHTVLQVLGAERGQAVYRIAYQYRDLLPPEYVPKAWGRYSPRPKTGQSYAHRRAIRYFSAAEGTQEETLTPVARDTDITALLSDVRAALDLLAGTLTRLQQELPIPVKRRSWWDRLLRRRQGPPW